MAKGMGAYEAMAMSPRRPKMPAKELSHLKLKEGETGGHVVTHEFTDYEHKPEEHIFGEDDGMELMKHMMEHANVKGVKVVKEGDSEEDE